MNVCSGGMQWICSCCNRQLKRGLIPLQAKANGLELTSIPSELRNLNALELRFVCLRVPFMKRVALPTGKQRSIHGPAINVPSKLDSICNLLPRLPSQTELIPLKLKRKFKFKGHYIYDYVTPDKITRALAWLKLNNPVYANVTINDQWSIDSDNDNSCLFSSLIGRCDNVNITKNVITEYDRHYNVLVKMSNERGFIIHDVLGNGDCLFSALAYQINTVSDGASLRKAIVDYLYVNPYTNGVHQGEFITDDIVNYKVEPTLSVEHKWNVYIQQLENGAWGDHIAVQGISNMVHVTIIVLSTIGESITVVRPTSTDNSVSNVYIGLIQESHYVGLDVVDSNNDEVETIVESETCNDSVDLDNFTIEQGDNDNIKITGGPQVCSVMSLDNPETTQEGQVYSVATAEGEHPIHIMTDSQFELMCNPEKFPFGTGGFNTTRFRKIT